MRKHCCPVELLGFQSIPMQLALVKHAVWQALTDVAPFAVPPTTLVFAMAADQVYPEVQPATQTKQPLIKDTDILTFSEGFSRPPASVLKMRRSCSG
jgi:hypothetical protein